MRRGVLDTKVSNYNIKTAGLVTTFTWWTRCFFMKLHNYIQMWILFTFTHMGIHFAGYIYNREEVFKKVTFQILTTCIVLTDEYSELGTVIQYVKDNGGHCYFSPDGGGVANSGWARQEENNCLAKRLLLTRQASSKRVSHVAEATRDLQREILDYNNLIFSFKDTTKGDSVGRWVAKQRNLLL